MSKLYLIEYGCSICTEHLVVSADSIERANEFAYQEAQSVYYSYECNGVDPDDYPGATEEELCEIDNEEMEQDIHYLAELYDPNDEDHQSYIRDQDNKPFEI